MAHEHTDEQDPYYLDQLCTIGICGAMAGVALLMCRPGANGKPLLDFLLVERFFPYVLYGGIVLLILTAIRAVTLWFTPAPAGAHHHDEQEFEGDPNQFDHDHGHAHSHSHSHGHSHGGDSGHDHGWNPWRYAVLLLPVVLFFLGLPNQGFSDEYITKQIPKELLEDSELLPVSDQAQKAITLNFDELTMAATFPDPAKRAVYEGKVGILVGQFAPGASDREGAVVRMKKNCCIADAVALVVKVIAPENLGEHQTMDWVEVEGFIQFRKVKARGTGKGSREEKYVPVLQLRSKADIRPAQPPARPDL